MYSINGVELGGEVDESRGWHILRGGTQAIAGIVREITEVRAPGYDGYFRVPSNRESKQIVFQMRVQEEKLETLLALLDTQFGVLTKTDNPNRVASFELVSAIPSGEFPCDEQVDLTVTLNVPGAAWRDKDATEYGPFTIASPTQVVDVLSGISAPVRDMDIFIGGVFGEFQLTDASGNWLRTTGPWAGSASTGLLYVGATGQAFTANAASPWQPVLDRSNAIDMSNVGGFQITPLLAAGNPADRRGRMSLTTLTQTNTTMRVRARNSYAMQ